MNSVTFVERADRFARRSGLAVSAIGVTSLLGWTLDEPTLKGFSANITMKPNTALALVLSGVALTLLARPCERALRRSVARALGILVGLVGGLTLFEHVSGVNLKIDQLLFSEPFGAAATASPGRMGPPAAISFLLSGFAFFIVSGERSYSKAQAAGAAVLLLGLFALVGYAYDTPAFYGVAKYTGTALRTAVALTLLGLGLLAVRADRGPTAPMSTDLAAAVSARRTLLIGLAGPLLLGWLTLRFERAALFDVSFGLSAVVLAVAVLFALTVVQQTSRIASYERLAIADSMALRQQQERVEYRSALIDLSYEPIFSCDLQGQVRDWSHGCERLYGFSKAQAIGAVANQLLRTTSLISREEQVTKLLRDNFWWGNVTNVTAGGRHVVVESRQRLVTLEGQRVVIQSDHEISTPRE